MVGFVRVGELSEQLVAAHNFYPKRYKKNFFQFGMWVPISMWHARIDPIATGGLFGDRLAYRRQLVQ
jgi:hypothetical protein